MFKDLFFDVVDDHAPVKIKKVRGKSKAWINSEVLDLIHRKDRLHRKFLASKSSSTIDVSAKARVEMEYKECRNLLTATIRQVKEEYYTSLIEDNMLNPKKLWQTLKSLLPNSKSSSPKELIVDGASVNDPKGIADSFNDYFTSIGQMLTTDTNKPDTPVLSKRVNDTDLSELPSISENHVRKMIEQMPNGQAVGLDGISPRLLKASLESILSPITWILNLSLKTGIVPDDFKLAKVILVPKSGPVDDRDNYRPISILPVVSTI